MRKAVLFDLDGTLANTLTDIRSAVNYALRVHGFPERTLEQIREYVGTGSHDLIRKSLPKGMDGDTIDRVHADYLERYYAYYLVETRPYDGLPELIGRLKGEGLALGVVTNKPDAHAHKVVERFFGQDFEYILGTREGIPTKPAPDMAYRAMKRLDADPKATLFVGDSDVDIKIARNAGLPGIIVTWGFCTLEELHDSGAEYLVGTPSELENKIYDLLQR